MTEVPRAKRDKPNEEYRKRIDDIRDSGIDPDRVTSSCAGYFRIPAVWLDRPLDSPNQRPEKVDEFAFCNGIILSSFQDGFFVFDFCNSSYAKQVFVPGYTTPPNGPPYRAPEKTQRAEESASRSIVERARLINVHQSLLMQGERNFARRAAASGVVISPRDLTRSIVPSGCLDYRVSSENVYSMAKYYLSGQQGSTFPSNRRTLEIGVVQEANKLIDRLLLLGDDDPIIMLDQLYCAAEHASQGRGGIALAAIWVVVEGLIFRDWQDYIKTRDIPRRRREKLQNMEYTASIVIEFLSAEGRYDQDLYNHIDGARSARNKWMHQLTEPTSKDLHNASQAASRLFFSRYRIKVDYSASNYQGGDAQWPIWMDTRTTVLTE